MTTTVTLSRDLRSTAASDPAWWQVLETLRACSIWQACRECTSRTTVSCPCTHSNPAEPAERRPCSPAVKRSARQHSGGDAGGRLAGSAALQRPAQAALGQGHCLLHPAAAMSAAALLGIRHAAVWCRCSRALISLLSKLLGTHSLGSRDYKACDDTEATAAQTVQMQPRMGSAPNGADAAGHERCFTWFDSTSHSPSLASSSSSSSGRLAMMVT